MVPRFFLNEFHAFLSFLCNSYVFSASLIHIFVLDANNFVHFQSSSIHWPTMGGTSSVNLPISFIAFSRRWRKVVSPNSCGAMGGIRGSQSFEVHRHWRETICYWHMSSDGSWESWELLPEQRVSAGCEDSFGGFRLCMMFTVATRSVMGWKVSCFCPSVLMDGDEPVPLHFFGILLDGFLEKVRVKGNEIEACESKYQSFVQE